MHNVHITFSNFYTLFVKKSILMKPADQAHTFFMYICIFQLDALEYIHENSYVHADVKASNCLLGYRAGRPDTDVVCVFDKFGLLLANFESFSP